MIKKHIHENLKHTVLKYLAKIIKKYSQFQTITSNNSKHISDFISNNTNSFLTPKQYYTLSHVSDNTDIFREFLQN